MSVIDEAMDRLLASFEQDARDGAALDSSFAPDLVITDWMAPGLESSSGAGAFYEPIGESFTELRFEVVDSMRDGNRLLVSGFFNGRMVKDYWGFPAHGRKVRWEARDIYRFDENGLIDRIWFANDTLTVARELGADITDERLW